MAAVEAAIGGARVIASDLPGIREALPHHGVFVPPHDLDEWRRALAEELAADDAPEVSLDMYQNWEKEDLMRLGNIWRRRHGLRTATNAPKVTVMMVSHNRPRFLFQAIEGILAQSMRDWELIIIDDSTDPKVRKVLESFRDPRIVWFHYPNSNLSWKRNQVLLHARAPLIANNDDDDISLPDRLKITVEAFEKDPQLGLFWGSARLIDHGGERVGEHRWDGKEGRRFAPHSGCVAFRTAWALETMYDEEWSTGQGVWKKGHDYDFYKRYRQKHRKARAHDGFLCQYRVTGPRVSSKDAW